MNETYFIQLFVVVMLMLPSYVPCYSNMVTLATSHVNMYH